MANCVEAFLNMLIQCLLFPFSGGKDSCYNLIECVREGHDIVALGNLKPAEKGLLLY